jgi:hypothetical protein
MAQSARASNMHPAEFRAILSRLGLTTAGAAELLGLTRRACEYYAAGARAVPPPVAKLLRLLDAGRVSAGQMRRA